MKTRHQSPVILVICFAYLLSAVVGCETQKSNPNSARIGKQDDVAASDPLPSEEPFDSPSVEKPAEPPRTDDSKNGESSGGAEFSMRILMWNVESEGADSKVIGRQLSELTGYDIYALCEVLPQDFQLFRDSLGKNFKYAYSKSGNNDRLQLLYNEDRFELVRQMELNDINFEGKYRSPLVVHLRDRTTSREFLVMNNHLARGKDEVRTKQAEQLVEWARDQTLPIIALGDYNFDFVFSTESGNDGFRAMLRDNVWKWVRPTELIDTNWYDPEPDGLDNFPGSLLDFAFVAGPATQWNATSNVIVREGDFPDDSSTSDHRPIELLIVKP